MVPSGDYDDSYSLEYARRHDGLLVSNDQFRDYVLKYPADKQADVATWIKDHRISFAWVTNEFLPNPDFHFRTGRGRTLEILEDCIMVQPVIRDMQDAQIASTSKRNRSRTQTRNRKGRTKKLDTVPALDVSGDGGGNMDPPPSIEYIDSDGVGNMDVEPSPSVEYVDLDVGGSMEPPPSIEHVPPKLRHTTSQDIRRETLPGPVTASVKNSSTATVGKNNRCCKIM